MNIKIISGGYGYRPGNGSAPVLVLAGECIDVPEEEASRLVSIGIAESVAAEPVAVDTEPVFRKVPDTDIPEEGLGVEVNEEAHMDAEQLATFTKVKLLSLAEEMGVECTDRMTKAQIIDAIVSEAVEVEEIDAEELPPALGAEAPVV